MSASLQDVVRDDPRGDYREFVLSPYFRTQFSAGALNSAFPSNQPSRSVVELAFISEVYDIDPATLIREVNFSGRRMGFDPDNTPQLRELTDFMRRPEWKRFVDTSSIRSYRNLVAYDPDELFLEKIVPDNLNVSTPDRLVSDLLAVNTGVALGDHHGDVCTTDFMQEQMPSLREQGVGTLYFEMIESHHQEALDKYMETGDISILEGIIDNAWDRKGAGEMRKEYIGVLEAAREQGIRIIAINKEEMGNRMHDSNPHWINVIEQDRESRPNEEKYVVYGGHYHFCDGSPNTRFPVVSVSKHLGIPSVEFHAGANREPVIDRGSEDHQNDFVVTLYDPNHKVEPKAKPQPVGTSPSVVS